MSRSLCIFLGLLLIAPVALSQATEGTVTGTVLGEQGQPIPGARVCIIDEAPNERRGNCFATTDKTGQFQVQHVPLGQHEVSASKPEDGYAESANHQAPQVVTLTVEDPLVELH